jgi:hypothetical protein
LLSFFFHSFFILFFILLFFFFIFLCLELLLHKGHRLLCGTRSWGRLAMDYLFWHSFAVVRSLLVKHKLDLPTESCVVWKIQYKKNILHVWTSCVYILSITLSTMFVVLQAGRSVRYPMVSLEFFIDVILLAALWHWV